MDCTEKVQVLQEVFDVDFASITEAPMGEDLTLFTKAVVNDYCLRWYDDEPFIEALMDSFPYDHPLWEFISLEEG